MKCLRPLILKDEDTARYGLYRCGKCYHCRQNQRNLWVLRMKHEADTCDKTVFVTLTYDDASLPVHKGQSILVKDHLQRYFKRLRKKDKKLRYFAAGEYGEKSGRAHYHAVVFAESGLRDDDLREAWPYGFVQVGKAHEGSLAYVAGYVSKKLLAGGQSDERPSEFHVSSQGLGSEWLRMHAYDLLAANFMLGHQLPRYYVAKLEEVFPDEVAGYRERLQRESDLALSDVMLELVPKFGGRKFEELTLDERIYARRAIAARAYELYEQRAETYKSKEMYMEVSGAR